MRYRYISDSHVHSDCSKDAKDSTMLMCESGAKLGFYSLTVTDHCECNVYKSEGYDKIIRQSYFEARKANAVFSSRINIFAGVELGQPMQDKNAAQEVLNSCNFDFVLASIHNVRDYPDFFDLDYENIDLDKVLENYFDEILETIEWGNFDSLAHLTYPWRYIVGEHEISIDNERYKEKIDEVLKALIKKNKALEVNTSGFRQKIGKAMPDLPTLIRYRELGGKLVTIGSDAHRWSDVGGGVEQGLNLLLKAGFNHFAVYSHHKPEILPIL